MSGYIWGSKGRAIQIIAMKKDTGSFELVSNAVEKLFQDGEVKDKKVCVISVAGAFRKGKSFLLNFFVKYLEKACERVCDLDKWLGSDDDTITGFEWRGESEREGTGIWAWSKVFILRGMAELDVDSGISRGTRKGEIAVVLLDTQGTFDSDSSRKECATVFALATLISSTLVFNLSQNIQEDDLQQLQLYAEYGRLAQKGGTTHDKPFQSLMFLVRDWQYPDEHRYGLCGGGSFLEKVLSTCGRHRDLTDVIQGIRDCFNKLDCCLLPHPGSKVAANRGSTCKLSDLGEEFKREVKEFVESIASFHNLVRKKANGLELTCGELVEFMKLYVKAFNGDDIPSATTLLQATAEANHLTALSDAKTKFLECIKQVCGAEVPYMDPKELDRKLEDIKSDAEKIFKDYPKLGSREMNEKYLGTLSNFVMETCEDYKQMNFNKANIFIEIQVWFHSSIVNICSFASSTWNVIAGLKPVVVVIATIEKCLPDLNISTPLTFVFIMVIFNILSVVFGWFGLSLFITFCLWIYLYFTWRNPDFLQTIDETVSLIGNTLEEKKNQLNNRITALNTEKDEINKKLKETMEAQEALEMKNQELEKQMEQNKKLLGEPKKKQVNKLTEIIKEKEEECTKLQQELSQERDKYKLMITKFTKEKEELTVQYQEEYAKNCELKLVLDSRDSELEQLQQQIKYLTAKHASDSASILS